MPDATDKDTLTNPQLLIKHYGVPMLFILTGVGLGWYLSKKASA